MDNPYCNQKMVFSKEILQKQDDPTHFRFYKKIRSVLFRTSCFLQAKKILIGVSGGIDSSVLLHELACFVAREGGPELIAVHINHGIRAGDADLDQQEAQRQAVKHGIPFFSQKVVVGNCASEEMLRNVRLLAFEDLASEHKASMVVLGQHMQDQAETLLLRLFRGAGVHGLSGMNMLRGDFWFRPLLHIEKKSIEQEAQHRNLTYRVDRSNFDTSYRRNAVRHNLIPMLQSQFNPNIIKSLSQLSESFASLDDFIDQSATPYAPVVRENQCELDCSVLESLHFVIRQRLYQRAFQSLSSVDVSLTKEQVTMIEGLVLRKQRNKSLQLSSGVGVVCSENVIIFSKG